MRSAIIIIITVIAVAVGGYFYWIGSPYFAFQQVLMASKNHDPVLFEQYVDAPKIIDKALDDLLVQPALSTPKLSGFQSTVASGALAMAKAQVTKGLLDSIDKSLAPNTAEPQPTGYWQNFGCDAAIAAPTLISPTLIDQTLIAQTPGRFSTRPSTGEGIKDLLHAASSEVSGEVGKLKSVAFNRMLAYIQSHPDTVPGRLLNCPPNERSAHARAMLEEYGLTAKNFKGMASCVGNIDMLGRETTKIGFNFYSPKISRLLVVEVELKRDATTNNVWRIVGLSNIKSVMDQVEEYYDRDIHELVEYSLSGMSNSNMAQDMRSMTDRLKQNPAAQNILQKLKYFR